MFCLVFYIHVQKHIPTFNPTILNLKMQHLKSIDITIFFSISIWILSLDEWKAEIFCLAILWVKECLNQINILLKYELSILFWIVRSCTTSMKHITKYSILILESPHENGMKKKICNEIWTQFLEGNNVILILITDVIKTSDVHNIMFSWINFRHEYLSHYFFYLKSSSPIFCSHSCSINICFHPSFLEQWLIDC